MNFANLILAQINTPNFDETMLEYIAQNDDPDLFIEKTYSREKNLIDAFIKHGKQNLLCAILERFPNLAKIQDEFGYTFLFDAAHAKLDNVCLKALENPELAKIQNVYGEIFLHEAMSACLTNVGLKALEIPELAKIQNRHGNTFLHIAAYAELKQVCLKAKSIIGLEKIKNKSGESYLDIAEKNNLFDQSKRTSPLDNLLKSRKNFLNEKTK